MITLEERAKLDFAWGNLACSTRHAPKKSAFRSVAKDRGWTDEEFEAWARDRQWSDE